MTKEQSSPGSEPTPLPTGYRGTRKKIFDVFPQLISDYNSGQIKRFPNYRELGEQLGVHPSTVSAVWNSPEVVSLQEGMKPIDRRHPKTPDIIAFYNTQFELLKTGKIRSLPSQAVSAAKYGVSIDTISAILNGPELSAAYQSVVPPPPDVVGRIERLLAEVAAGERIELPSNVEIAREYGVSPSRVGQLARQFGLQDGLVNARNLVAEKEAKAVVFPKTKESAWFLGAMFGKGALKNSGPKYTGIIFTHNEPEVLDAFKYSGEFLTGRTGLERQMSDRYNPAVIFNHTGFAQLLSPFSIDSRAEQFETPDYKWLRYPLFLTSFVSGLFDASGNPYFRDKSRRIAFATTETKVADFLLSTLKRFGIKQPRIDRQGRDNPKPQKVYFGTLPDLKLFADKVTSVSPRKQAVLDRIDAYEPTPEEIVRQFDGKYAKQVYP